MSDNPQRAPNPASGGLRGPRPLDPFAAFGAKRLDDGTMQWPDQETIRNRALAGNIGDRRWRAWKQVQADELIELVGSSSRIGLLDVNLEGDFNALVYISTPVPIAPEHGRLRIGDHALVHLHYESVWLSEPIPSWMPAGVVSPRGLFLPNAAMGMQQPICLGAISPGTPVTDLLLLSYYALSLQTAMLDETEGVMNAQACEFYRDHPEYMPLTRTGLLDPWSLDDLQHLDATLISTDGGQS